MIEWLRKLMPRYADQVQFGYPDGSIRHHDKVVIRAVSWDEYDTPTFEFVESSYNIIQKERQAEILLREHTLFSYQLEEEEICALKALEKEPYRASNVRRSDLPEPIVALKNRGLVAQDETNPGWDTEGNYVANHLLQITPQARGFLRYQAVKEGSLD